VSPSTPIRRPQSSLPGPCLRRVSRSFALISNGGSKRLPSSLRTLNQVLTLMGVVLKSLPDLFWLLGEGEPPDLSPPTGAFGHDYGTWIVVRQDGVWSVDSTGRSATRYVCSSKEKFEELLAVFAERNRRGRLLSEDELATYHENVREQLRAVDPTAVSEAGHWWSLVAEQCEDGLM
jgi:hypothetical protein